MKSKFLQKILCISISLLLFGTSPSISAIERLSRGGLTYETSTKDKIVFDKSEYDDLNDLESGIKKVNKYGLKDNIADNMDEETLRNIGRSQYMTSKITYFVEEKDVQTDKYYTESVSDLIVVDEKTYNNLLESERNSIIERLRNSVTVIGVDGYEKNDNTISGSDEISKDTDSGKIRVIIDSYHYIDQDGNYFFEVVNQFIWDTMPKGRGTDIFGISRGNNTAHYPHSEGGYYEYLEQEYGGYATINGWNPFLLSSEIKTVDCENDDLSNNSSAIRIDMPVDNIPSTVIVGNYYFARVFPSLLGVTWYRGTLAQIIVPSINNIEHWGTLQHQHNGKLSLNPSFGVSYPLNMSFTINPTYSGKYTKISTSILDTVRIAYE